MRRKKVVLVEMRTEVEGERWWERAVEEVMEGKIKVGKKGGELCNVGVEMR